jgi:two-component system, cell cycle sensor histidine kinase and response regulator CckA
MKNETLPNAAVDSPAPIRVLVVDDEPAVRRFAERVLSSAGYVVETASNGPEALDIVQNAGAFDLFVIDEMMPDMRGRELADELRQRQPDAKVLYYTGNLDLLLQDTNVFVENEAVLAKPVSVDGLREAVARLLSDSSRDPAAR